MNEARTRPVSRPARENPFRVSRLHDLRYRLDDDGWSRLLERLRGLDRRAALVGPEGSGKTTLLEELEERLEREGWSIVRVRLKRERRRPTHEEWRQVMRAGGRDLVTVDGVELLSWWRWRRLERATRRAAGLVVTSHRAGRLPTLRRHRTDPELLRELVSELVGEDGAAALESELDHLFDLHHGNLRSCLRSLYDQWAVSRSSDASTSAILGSPSP